jgi:hypothetical protein
MKFSPGPEAARLPGSGAGERFEAVAESLSQAAVFTAKHLLCSLAGALALRARRQILGGHVVFVARCSNGLAAEAENAQRSDAVTDPIW